MIVVVEKEAESCVETHELDPTVGSAAATKKESQTAVSPFLS
jgi:hypothetical protein